MIEILAATPVGAISATQPLEFDVRTDTPNIFRRILVGVYYPGAQMQEFAYAGVPMLNDSFFPMFDGSSATLVVDSGYERWHFVLSRKTAAGQPMWPDNPKLAIYAFNDAGEEV